MEFGDGARRPTYIVTERRVGYRMGRGGVAIPLAAATADRTPVRGRGPQPRDTAAPCPVPLPRRRTLPVAEDATGRA